MRKGRLKRILRFQSMFLLAAVYSTVGQQLYWLEGATAKIRSASVADFSPQDVYTGLNGAYAIAIGSAAIYWTEPNAQRIRVGYEGNPTASTLLNLSAESAIPRGIVVDGTTLYWTDAGNKKIRGANTDGSNVHDVLTTGLVSPGSLAIEHAAQRLYWADNGTGAKSIVRCDISGANVETVVTGLGQVWAITLDTDAGKVYWIDTGADKIQWASYTGSLPAAKVDLVTGLQHNARGMVLDVSAQKIYWSDITNSAIRRHTISAASDSVLPAFYAQGVAIGPSIVLPVELIGFAASASKNEIILRWQTGTEVENFGFEIERRMIRPLQSDWTNVGFIAGAGTSSSPRQYSFSERNVQPGRYAYRLKQFDRSGTYRYTSAVEVEVGSSPLEFSLSANYPNPFNPSTMLEFTVPENGRTTLKVYNAIGQEVATLVDRDLETGSYHSIHFDASMLPSGTYYARLAFKAESLTRMLVLLK